MFKVITKNTWNKGDGTIDGLRREQDDDGDKLVRNYVGEKHLDLLTLMCAMSDFTTGREIKEDDEGLCELAKTAFYEFSRSGHYVQCRDLNNYGNRQGRGAPCSSPRGARTIDCTCSASERVFLQVLR